MAQRIFFIKFHSFVNILPHLLCRFSHVYIFIFSDLGWGLTSPSPPSGPWVRFCLAPPGGDLWCRAHLFWFLLSFLIGPINPHYFVSSLMPLFF